jgi:TolB protein
VKRTAAYSFVLPALLVAAFAARAQDERPTVVITDPNARTFRAAVQEFAKPSGSSGGGASGLDTARFRSELADALDFSGVFSSLDPAAFLAPRRTASLGNTLACVDWTPIGADAVVEGVTSGGATIAIDFRVWDVARCTALLHKRYTGGANDAGRIAKRIADDVVEAFTGKRGVASTEIAYVSSRSGAPEIWVMDADGGHARQATRNKSINGFPAWSPDGNAIVYMSYLFERSPHLFRLVRGGGLKAGRMLEGLDGKTPVYRGVYDPSGQRLAVVVSMDGAPEIYVVDADGRNPRRLTRHQAIDVSPTWSPDGRRIAFVSDRSGTPNLYVMDADGGNLRRLTFGGYHTAPAWSPDGRWIAYEVRAGGGQFDIWLADPEGQGQAPLITHPRSDESPSWAPDSRKLAFQSSRTGRPEVYVVDVDGENVRQITRGSGENTAPNWGPYPR